MIAKSNAKINIGLRIIGKRFDGYHLLEGLMIPIPLYDVIELVEKKYYKDKLHLYGIIPPVNNEDNLITKSITLFRTQLFPKLPGIHCALYKNIPFGAGMGGGSSNASTVLKLLRNKYRPDICDEELKCISLKLGADCPFFIKNVPQIARGIGEELSEYKNLDLNSINLLLIKPNINISTKEAFAGINISKQEASPIEDLLSNDITKWQNTIYNQFEQTLFPLYPILKDIKEWMLSNGALYASMTGSGATIYSLNNMDISTKAKEQFPNLFIKNIIL